MAASKAKPKKKRSADAPAKPKGKSTSAVKAKRRKAKPNKGEGRAKRRSARARAERAGADVTEEAANRLPAQASRDAEAQVKLFLLGGCATALVGIGLSGIGQRTLGGWVIVVGLALAIGGAHRLGRLGVDRRRLPFEGKSDT